jgi:glycosyltransferase involved in cell wall biosynthesis
MRLGLIVTTCERPDALARVLTSINAQTDPPDEVIVADDGSSPVTRDVVDACATRARFDVRHVWQPHEGFRAGRIRNEAIASSRCDYLVLLDGDMVLHPSFLADHRALACPGHFSQGVRVLLDAAATSKLLAGNGQLPGAASAGLGALRRAYAIHAPWLARRLTRAANSFVAVKSCNQGFWREHLIAANGFDEAMPGWGAEDKELCARLTNAGVRRRSLMFAAIAFHLAHPPASRDRAAANLARWQDTVRGGRRRCELGLDGHQLTAPLGLAAGSLL